MNVGVHIKYIREVFFLKHNFIRIKSVEQKLIFVRFEHV